MSDGLYAVGTSAELEGHLSASEADRFVADQSEEVWVASMGDSEEGVQLNLLVTYAAFHPGRLIVEPYNLLLHVFLGNLVVNGGC